MAALGEELLLVALNPDEGRNTRNHQGSRVALCAAQVLDRWIADEPLPAPKELRPSPGCYREFRDYSD